MIDRVARLLREAAAEAIIPRYRRLNDGDIHEKSPGEVVTTADRHAEEIITAGLMTLFPEARVVGEEACAMAPIF